MPETIFVFLYISGYEVFDPNYFGKPVSQARNVSMAETLTTKFSDSQSGGKIKLYANAFANGSISP